MKSRFKPKFSRPLTVNTFDAFKSATALFNFVVIRPLSLPINFCM